MCALCAGVCVCVWTWKPKVKIEHLQLFWAQNKVAFNRWISLLLVFFSVLLFFAVGQLNLITFSFLFIFASKTNRIFTMQTISRTFRCSISKGFLHLNRFKRFRLCLFLYWVTVVRWTATNSDDRKYRLVLSIDEDSIAGWRARNCFVCVVIEPNQGLFHIFLAFQFQFKIILALQRCVCTCARVHLDRCAISFVWFCVDRHRPAFVAST